MLFSKKTSKCCGMVWGNEFNSLALHTWVKNPDNVMDGIYLCYSDWGEVFGSCFVVCPD